MTQILLAEDHPLVVAGINHILEQHLPSAELSIAEDFPKVLNLLNHRHFDLLLLDINIPGGDKIGMIRSVRMKQPKIPILICSSYDEQIYALPYLKAGANGYVSKNSASTEFKAAIECVLSGKIYASPNVLQHVLDTLMQVDVPVNNLSKLSDRERDVARLLARGLSTKSISDRLSLSAPSVSIYKGKIFEKLGVSNVVELTTYFDLNE